MKDLGVSKKIFGIEIQKDMSDGKLWLCLKSYDENVLDKFIMSNSKVMNTPWKNHSKLSSDQCPKKDAEAEYVSKVPYANVVGYLMYPTV